MNKDSFVITISKKHKFFFLLYSKQGLNSGTFFNKQIQAYILKYFNGPQKHKNFKCVIQKYNGLYKFKI